MEITSELKEILNPGKAALLVWDVQNMLVQNIFNTDAFLANTNSVITSAKAHEVPVIFSKITPLPEKFESPVRKHFFKSRLASMKQVPNGFDLTIEPTAPDIVIPKNTASMFVGTNFELLLRNAGITTIVIVGIATEIGVESTARDASNRGFFPVIITDAVSSYNKEAHLRSLENMKSMMILLTTEELALVWK
ncbi:MAG TPA: isochorismatase family cysteine hydrolase [Williamwhitmania sp.]|nr:isochorismatase family cysteine hydrolase [Williamwhitmania sp.]